MIFSRSKQASMSDVSPVVTFVKSNVTLKCHLLKISNLNPLQSLVTFVTFRMRKLYIREGIVKIWVYANLILFCVYKEGIKTETSHDKRHGLLLPRPMLSRIEENIVLYKPKRLHGAMGAALPPNLPCFPLTRSFDTHAYVR